MSVIEFRLAASPAQLPAARQVTWPAPGRSGTLTFNLSPTLSAFELARHALHRMGVNDFLMGYLARFDICGLNIQVYSERIRSAGPGPGH